METDPSTETPGELRAWMWTGAGYERTGGVPVTDRGFRYGMSVFESFPVRDGVVFFLEKHRERLRAACETVGFCVPLGALEECEAPLVDGSGFGRIYVTAGDGTVSGDFEECRVLVALEERPPPGAAKYHRGYDLGLHTVGHVPIFAGLKTGNYWGNLRAFREGIARNCNETLLFTPAGHLIAACMANVFIVSNGRVKTPELSTGARSGVVREWVMERAAVEEAIITRTEVEAAEEIFLTSSWLGIMPGASLEERPIKDWKVSGPLLTEYRKELEKQRAGAGT
jgi:branched-subunit amino acid aminotransferase/4-amino-4-deoxychorismate lyase